MREWSDRSREIANLLNPAFCGEILRRAILAYQADFTQGMPFSLIYTVLPTVMHRKTREMIFDSGRKSMHVWLEEVPQVKIGFGTRVKDFKIFTNEAICFLSQHSMIDISENGIITASYTRKSMITNWRDAQNGKKDEYLYLR